MIFIRHSMLDLKKGENKRVDLPLSMLTQNVFVTPAPGNTGAFPFIEYVSDNNVLIACNYGSLVRFQNVVTRFQLHGALILTGNARNMHCLNFKAESDCVYEVYLTSFGG